MNKCPHCQGKQGFYEKRVCTYTQYFDWGKLPIIASEMERTLHRNIQYCMDCNKKVEGIYEDE